MNAKHHAAHIANMMIHHGASLASKRARKRSNHNVVARKRDDGDCQVTEFDSRGRSVAWCKLDVKGLSAYEGALAICNVLSSWEQREAGANDVGVFLPTSMHLARTVFHKETVLLKEAQERAVALTTELSESQKQVQRVVDELAAAYAAMGTPAPKRHGDNAVVIDVQPDGSLHTTLHGKLHGLHVSLDGGKSVSVECYRVAPAASLTWVGEHAAEPSEPHEGAMRWDRMRGKSMCQVFRAGAWVSVARVMRRDGFVGVDVRTPQVGDATTWTQVHTVTFKAPSGAGVDAWQECLDVVGGMRMCVSEGTTPHLVHPNVRGTVCLTCLVAL